MKGTHRVLAKRYAHSFIGAFGIHRDWLPSLQKLAHLFVHNRSFVVMLSLPSVSPDQKLSILREAFGYVPFGQALDALIQLLLTTKRIILLGLVLWAIVEEYYQALAITQCIITSSHPLTQSDKASIAHFITRTTGRTSVCEYKIDQSLIAGLRIQADTQLWEYSIRKQLRALHAALVR